MKQEFIAIRTEVQTLAGSMSAEMAAVRRAMDSMWGLVGDLSPGGRAATKAELYPAMSKALSLARKRAFVTYFSPRSPSEPRNENEEAYHSAFQKAVHTQTTVDFKRIVAIFPTDTPGKREWIRKEIQTSQGVEYQIKFLVASDPKLLPYNVQIFDDMTFLIDPSRTNDASQPRDIHLLDSAIASIFARYYLELFGPLPALDTLDAASRAKINQ